MVGSVRLGRGKIKDREDTGVGAGRNNDEFGLERIKHGFRVGAGVSVMTGNDDIYIAEVLSDGHRGFVDGGIVDINICQIDNLVFVVFQDGNDGVGVFMTAVLSVEIVKTEGHVAHTEGEIVAIAVSGVPMDYALFGDIDNIGTKILHCFRRLIDKSLIMPGRVTGMDKVIFQIIDVQVFFVIVGCVAVNQMHLIAGYIRKRGSGDLGNAADVV